MTRAELLLAMACASMSCVDGAAREVDWADVQPRLARSCLGCHGEGAPPGRAALASYEDASGRAREMLLMVEAGAMPPGGVDRSGACGDFMGPRPFSPEDTRALRAWIEAGTPRGAIEPATPPVPADDGARALDVVLPLLPALASDPDRQRCFTVAAGGGSFLVGVRMEAPGAAHHAMVFTIPDDAALADAWPCDGVPRALSGEQATLAFAWVPGSERVRFPAGTGAPLSARLIVQLHEHGAVDEGERAALTLLVTDAVERPLAIAPVALAGFTLPPGDEVQLAQEVALPAGEIFGVMPHLHAAGRALELTSRGIDDDATGCIVSAPRYAFTHQEVAFFVRPLTIRGRARGTLTCAWDTRDRSTSTRWGEGSLDEMCTVFLFVAAPG